MKNQKVYLAIISCAVLIITSCEKVPSQDISQKVITKTTHIDANDDWYGKLIPDSARNTAMVNASNEDTDRTGSGGLNKAFQDYFDYKEQDKNSWGTLYKSDGTEHQKGQQVAPGDFVYSKHEEPVAFDWQLHAVGPRKAAYKSAEETENFKDAQELIKNLIYNMLEFARINKIDNIVIPSISTNIFSDGDEIYKQAMFDGMSQGLFKFFDQYGYDTKPDKIYLTWNKPGVERYKHNLEEYKAQKD